MNESIPSAPTIGGQSEADRTAAMLQPAYRNYVLTVLLFGFALNFLDRQIISILMQPIKDELHVSDTLLGFLSGLSFALFYATLGIPIARLADYRSRRIIITASMAVWSAMTAICGLAQNYVQLVLARFGVGIGEAGFSPAALSMIADYFPREKRAGAVAITGVGAMLGTMLGLLIGGQAVELFGWRGAMMVAGIPGIAFAFILWATVKEPLRGMADGVPPKPGPRVGMLKSAAHLWRVRSFRYIALGAGLSSFAMFGLTIWMPSFLARSYGMAPGQIGLILGPVLGGVGALGALASGYLNDKLFTRDSRWTMWLSAIASVGAIPLMAGAFLANTATMTIVLFALGNFLSIFYSPPTSSVIQSVVPLDMRATGVAWKLMMVNLVGLGLGPQFVGFLSETLSRLEGTESLRHAMLYSVPVFAVPAVLYLLAARHLKQDALEQGGVTI